MTPICPELLYARKIGSNFEGRPFVKCQILEIMRNVKTFFETLTINILEFKRSPALKNISKFTTNLWYTIRIYQRTGAHLVQWCWCWDADNADYADDADDAEILIMLIMLIMLMMLMMLTVILVTPRMSRLWWRRKGSQGSSSITASSGRRKDSQHRWRFSSSSSSGFNRPKICEHSISCKKSPD